MMMGENNKATTTAAAAAAATQESTTAAVATTMANDNDDWRNSNAAKAASYQDVLQNLDMVEGSLSQLLEQCQANHGKYGFITREWGFTTPNGLGGRLRGKFQPWEDKLDKVKYFFWPVDAYYEKFEKQQRKNGDNSDNKYKDLPITSEQLFGNTPLHEFLMEPPVPTVELDIQHDLKDWRTSAKIFILLGTLSHLCGNSKRGTALPEWIEDPLRVVAKRLQVKPTLTGHFLVQENWVWRSTINVGLTSSDDNNNNNNNNFDVSESSRRSAPLPLAETTSGNTTSSSLLLLTSANVKDSARAIVRTLLEECEINDRRYRLVMYQQCFIGSQAVDVIIDNGYATTREEAVYLLRKINDAFRLFSHVTNDHLLKDQMLFYRFKKKWRTQQRMSGSIQGTTPGMATTASAVAATASATAPQSPRAAAAAAAAPAAQSDGGTSGGGDEDGGTSGDGDEDGGVDGADQQVKDDSAARDIVRALLEQAEIKDRRYRLLIYRQCFIGSQAVDVIVDNGYAESREEAVNLLREINGTYHLFSHVTNDHLLKDQMLFYRFEKKWKRKQQQAKSGAATGGGFIGDSNNNNNTNDLLDSDDSEEDDEQDRREHNRPIFSSATGRVSLSIRSSTRSSTSSSPPSPRNKKNSPRTGGDSAAMQLRSSGSVNSEEGSATSSAKKHRREQQELMAAVSAENDGEDDVLEAAEEPAATIARPDEQIQKVLESPHPARWRNMNTQSLERALININQSSYEEIAAAIAAMRYVSIKDRRYRLKVYRQCFVGSQLIDVLMEHECAKSSRIDALRLARKINHRYRIMEHVCGDHDVKDEYLFYRFTDAFDQMAKVPALGSKLFQRSFYTQQQQQEPSSFHHSDDNAASLSNNRGDTEYRRGGSSVSDGGFSASTSLTSQHGSNSNDDDASMFEDFILDDEAEEFRFDNIDMLYPAFRNNHERVNQLIPACMGYALRSLPCTVIDILTTMRDLLEAKLNILDANTFGGADNHHAEFYEDDEAEATKRLSDLLYKVAFSVSRCKEQFQLMSTDPSKRTYNSIHVSIRQTQPLSNGVLVRRVKGGEPLPSKGTTGTQFSYFHLLDWLIGRYQYNSDDEKEGSGGLVAQLSSVDACYPKPQREYITLLSKLHKASTLRGFLDVIGRPQQIMNAYNHLIECYSGEGGALTAHCRKLYSYMHNDLQSSTSGTNHAGMTGENTNNECSAAEMNHAFAKMMFKAMMDAREERYRLRIAPLMTEVTKVVYSTSESGGFTTVALNLADKGLSYEYGDVVRVLLPNDDKTTTAWVRSLGKSNDSNNELLTLSDMPPDDERTGWGWKKLWEALGWVGDDGKEQGVPLATIAKYIEQAQIRSISNTDDAADGDKKKSQWVNSPLDLCREKDLFAVPPKIPRDRIMSLIPVSPRLYSVSGVESDRVFLLVSKPLDGARHHGYERMADPIVTKVHCSFAPSTYFLMPPVNVNLVCVASGTGISPFVGLADAIGSRRGMYTIAHQCKSSDLFLTNVQTWLDFTAINPGAVVMGYISGDRSRRNCPMRYVIRNGLFEETAVLGRHNSSAYYFQCPAFQIRLREVYKPNNHGMNLAYCCGGVQSAIEPLKEIFAENYWKYEFTCESYSAATTLNKNQDFSCQIGGTIIDLDAVAPIHEGGDQILHKVHRIAIAKKNQQEGTQHHNCPNTSAKSRTPDLSEAFFKLHPHAYNLLRCSRTPIDADFEAFTAFLERQSASKSIIAVSATKYSEVALGSPDNSKVVRIASELQSTSIVRQVNAGDIDGAKRSAEYLEALLEHIPDEDVNTRRWRGSLDYLKESHTNSH